MTEAARSEDGRRIAGDEALAGILALLVADREERLVDSREPVKTEVLLANAGVSVDGIVKVTGKTRDAVRKTLQRARKT